MELSRKVVVVTGGGNGIGAGLARRFGADGAEVVVADLDIRAAGRVAAEIGGLAVEADVGNEADVVRLIQATEDRYGLIDLFCANAGIAFPGSEQSPDDDWDRMWRVNFLSHVYAARHLIPAWQARGSGYFLATASAAGLLTNIGAAQYSVTKHAVVALAEWLSITYGDQGVKVSCLCPQGVETRMLKESGPVADLLLPTAISVEEVANVVVEGLRRESFLILPHPEVGEYLRNKATDHDRWLRGMRRLQQKVSEATTMEE
jgi:NAD(P)-dependent dehydrogenase (short-subunit alcohol dehydrogenase family)